jgi:Fe-S-cluster containining protein
MDHQKNPRNTWAAKLKRTFTAILPVSKDRKGRCINCGACCRLPNVCWFLRYKADGSSYCSVYSIRPLNCRKYPRTESELVTPDSCGHHFETEAL